MLAPIDQYYRYIDTRRVFAQSMSTTQILCTFINWIGLIFPDEKYFTQEMFDVWCQKRDTEAWNTFVNRIGHLKGFVKYLADLGYDEYFLPCYSKRKEHPFYTPISEAEIMNFITASDEISNFELAKSENTNNANQKIQRIIKALILPVSSRFLYASGVRPTEIRLLERNSIDLNTGIIKISASETKGYRERMIAVSEEMRLLFMDYDCKMNEYVPNRRVFFSKANGENYSDWWWRRVFRECWDRYNQGTGVVAYNMRHNYVIENIAKLDGTESDKHMLALSASLGHSSLNRTMYYAHMTPRLASALERADPDFLKEV